MIKRGDKLEVVEEVDESEVGDILEILRVFRNKYGQLKFECYNENSDSEHTYHYTDEFVMYERKSMSESDYLDAIKFNIEYDT